MGSKKVVVVRSIDYFFKVFRWMREGESFWGCSRVEEGFIGWRFKFV